MSIYTTRQDAEAAIVAAIESGDANATDFDVTAIFDATHVFDADRQVFVQTADETEFWQAVQDNAR